MATKYCLCVRELESLLFVLSVLWIDTIDSMHFTNIINTKSEILFTSLDEDQCRGSLNSVYDTLH